MLNQAINISSWKLGNKLQLETEEDFEKRAQLELDELKRKGLW